MSWVHRPLAQMAGATERHATLLGWVGAVGVAYFLAAQIGLALLSAPSDIAVFWPASGVAAGILIAFGRRALPAVVIGVIVSTIAANVLGDRDFWTSLFKGVCNASEAVLMAWLIEQWFGRAFAFADLRHVLGFFAAAGFAAAASAVGGAATMTLLHATAPFWDAWLVWFLSDGLGIVVIAPLLIAISETVHKPMFRAELVEGAGVVALLVVIAIYVRTHPAELLGFIQSGSVRAAALVVAHRPLPTGVRNLRRFHRIHLCHCGDDIGLGPLWRCGCAPYRAGPRRADDHLHGDGVHPRAFGLVQRKTPARSRTQTRCGAAPTGP